MVIIVMAMIVIVVVRDVDVEERHVFIVDFAESAQVLLRLVKCLVTVPPHGKVLVEAGLLVSTVDGGQLVVELAVEFGAVELGEGNESLGEVLEEQFIVLSILFNPLFSGRVLQETDVVLVSIVNVLFAEKLHLEVGVVKHVGVLGPARLRTLLVSTVEANSLRATNKGNVIFRGQIEGLELLQIEGVENSFRSMLDSI